MQSIREQEAEGEHILSLDLDLTAVQDLQWGSRLQNLGRLLITHYTRHQSRPDYHSMPWIRMSPLDWESFQLSNMTFCFNIFLVCFTFYMTFKNVRLDLKRSGWIMSGGGDQSWFRLSACSSAVHSADWCFIIPSLYQHFLLDVSKSQEGIWKTEGGCGHRFWW